MQRFMERKALATLCLALVALLAVLAILGRVASLPPQGVQRVGHADHRVSFVVLAAELAIVALAVAGWLLYAARRQAPVEQFERAGRRTTLEEERRLAAVIRSSDDAIVTKSLEGIVTTWNAGAERLFGYSTAEAVGRSISFLIPPERIDEERRILGRVARNERVESFDTVRVAKDGRRLDVSVTVSPIRDVDGRVVGAAKIAREITRRKDAEESLRRRIGELEALFAVLPNGVAVADDPACRSIRSNPTFSQLLGLPLNANASKSAPADERPTNFRVTDVDGRELAADELPMQVAARTARSVSNMEVYVVHTNGRVIPLLANAEPLLDDAGRVRGVVGAFWDLTEVGRAEAEVRRLNEELRQRVAELEALFAAIPIGVAVADDRECHVIRANPVLAHMLGMPTAANVSKTPPEDGRPRPPSPYDATAGKSPPTRFLCRSRRGKVYPYTTQRWN